MRVVRFGLIQIGVLSLLIGLSNTASARTRVYIGVGFGHSDFHRGYRHDYRWGTYGFPYHYRYFEPVCYDWGWRHYHPFRETIIVGAGDWYWGEPDYYVVAQPPVIEKQVVVVQPEGYDKSTQELFKDLRYRKSELLKKLQMPDKEQRKEAINELAGFSFDDKVRRALENVLLSDPDPELRKEVARMFGKVKNTKALAALEKARVEDSSEDVRKEADQTIKKLEAN